MPATITGLRVPVPGAEIVADLYTSPSAGRRGIISYHGYTLDRRQKRSLAERCSEKGYIALNVDMRGHGESSGEYNADECARDLVHLAGLMRREMSVDDVTVEGTSAGAYIGFLSSIYDINGNIDRFAGHTLPGWLKPYEDQPMYRGAGLINIWTAPLFHALMRRYHGHIVPLIRERVNPLFDYDPEKDEFRIRNAHTRNIRRFRKGSWGSAPLKDLIGRMNGSPYLVIRTPDDMHIDPEDTTETALAMLGAGKDVTILELPGRFTRPDEFLPVADALMDWVEKKAA